MKTYDPKQVIVLVGGRQMTGFAEGTEVKVSRDKDSWELTMGVDGEATRTKSNDKSGTIVISLMNSSDSNDILNAFYLADELSNSGVVPVLIKDLTGKSLHVAEQAWVQKPADAEYAKTANAREWTLRTGELQHVLGGSN